MRVDRFALVPITLLVAACAGFPFWSDGKPGKSDLNAESAGAAPGVKLELQDIRYDGQDLSGRLLVSPLEEAIRFDKRLIESSALSVKEVRDCATGQPLEYIVFVVRAARPRDEDWLVLHPGFWYGKDVRIPLFAAPPSGQQGPECIELEIEFQALRKKPFPLLQVRAALSVPPSTDAGTPAAPAP